MIVSEPFVSIVTPVYNGEHYLAECIESVINQTYQNWEYLIVNNCSTDQSLEIAKSYADKDKRIKVFDNDQFLSVIDNHNNAFRQISRESKYCKVVSADDWIYPECLSKMIALAEKNPSVGIVGSYQLSGNEVKWQGLPQDKAVFSGKELCRLAFLENLQVFGTPTSSLYNSSLIHKNDPFFPHLKPYADTSAVYRYLQFSDFGFIHEILCIERLHQNQVSAKVMDTGMNFLDFLDNLNQYGPVYLSDEELVGIKKNVITGCWRWLGGCILKLKGVEFWRIQTARLKELGYDISWKDVFLGSLNEMLDELHNPKVAFNKFLNAVKNR